ncbi:MAG: hypothetical protein U0136_00845 [Bdellovibrionota bacterium]
MKRSWQFWKSVQMTCLSAVSVGWVCWGLSILVIVGHTFYGFGSTLAAVHASSLEIAFHPERDSDAIRGNPSYYVGDALFGVESVPWISAERRSEIRILRDATVKWERGSANAERRERLAKDADLAFISLKVEVREHYLARLLYACGILLLAAVLLMAARSLIFWRLPADSYGDDSYFTIF